jgi:hypothetical protein
MASSSSTSSTTSTSTVVGPTIVPSANGMIYAGCYLEPPTGRALSGYVISDVSMTVPRCVDTCRERGFVFAGLEYEQECWCGNALAEETEGPMTKEEEGRRCGMPCGGDRGTLCGGPRALSVYH